MPTHAHISNCILHYIGCINKTNGQKNQCIIQNASILMLIIAILMKYAWLIIDRRCIL